MADSRADYTRGGVTGLISEREGTTTRTYHGDQLGSTRGLTSSSQSVTHSRDYDAFGMTVGGTGLPTPFGFVGGQGYQKDPDSGLMLLGARYYDPSVGRFISRDPIGYAGGLNLYGYCGNNPVGASDPSGLISPEGILGGLLGGGVAAIAFAGSPFLIPAVVVGAAVMTGWAVYNASGGDTNRAMGKQPKPA
ncbi:MAG: RHS repeat-associated core domain-containing protein [Armatimonadota bacterium]